MKVKQLILVLVAIGLLATLSWVGVSFLSGSRALASAYSQQKWEYLVVVVKGSIWADAQVQAGTLVKALGTPFYMESTTAQEALDAVGKQGWELVTVVGILKGDQEFVFKRPLP